jgi:hypothetical protein
MSRFTSIIIADSRGRGLEDFIGGHPTPITHEYWVEVCPEKSIPQLADLIINTIESHDIDHLYCIVFAGICGLTERVRDGQLRTLRYPEESREKKVQETTDTISRLKFKYQNRLNFCTLVPASLADYFLYHNPATALPDYLTTEQQALEQDIIRINRTITKLNLSQGITNVNLSSRFEKKSKKKRQRSGNKVVYRRISNFKYTDLTDGVHFNDLLKSTCFTLIVNTSIRDSQTILDNPTGPGSAAHRLQSWPVSTDQPVSDNSGDETSSQDDWGDFRRHPNKTADKL